MQLSKLKTRNKVPVGRFRVTFSKFLKNRDCFNLVSKCSNYAYSCRLFSLRYKGHFGGDDPPKQRIALALCRS